MKKTKLKKYRGSFIRLGISVFLLLTAGLLWLLIKSKPKAFFPAYRNVSRTVMKAVSAVTGLVPFSIWDVGAAVLALGAVVFLAVVIVRRRGFLTWLTSVILILSLLASFAADGWLLNHYAPKLASEIGLEVRKYTEEELYLATKYYMDRAAEYAPLQARDRSGSLVRQDFKSIAKKAGKSYDEPGKQWKIFRNASGAPVKKLSVTGGFYLKRGIAGIFMPLTAESSVPELDAVADLPYTMAHECAHRLGIASEEEANFAAYLACDCSDDPYFLYSGYYSAYIFCRNKLAKADSSWSKKLNEAAVGEGYELLFQDVRESAAWYKNFEKEKAVKKMETVNDNYLKTFSQEEGVKSYGEVVNDLIAWYLLKE